MAMDKYTDPLGPVISKDDIHMRETDQFATDTHFYFQWLTSPLRVHRIEDADIVFVPGIVARPDPFYEQARVEMTVHLIGRCIGDPTV